MTNEQIIFNEVCSNYDSAQRHDLVSRFYTAEQVQGIAAGLELVPDDNGNTPDPIRRCACSHTHSQKSFQRQHRANRALCLLVFSCLPIREPPTSLYFSSCSGGLLHPEIFCFPLPIYPGSI